MGFILCSSAVVIYLVSQVISQPPPKPTVEWSPDRAGMYPNPWKDSAKCNRPELSGLCDVNEILTTEQRNYFGEKPELNGGKQPCDPSKFEFAMAIMKHIGPDITDYVSAAGEFAVKFRDLWNLTNCTIILIASKVDNTGVSAAGSAVKKLLPVNKTEEINQTIYENYFKIGLFVQGLNETMIQYRNALEESQTTLNYDEKESSATKITVGVIVGVLIVLIIITLICVTCVIINKRKKKTQKHHMQGAELLSSPKAV